MAAGSWCTCGHRKAAHASHAPSWCTELGCPCLAYTIARDQERARILGKFRTLRGEILQTFVDIDSWNTHVRKPDEAPIDPDPGGELRRLVAAIDDLLAADTGSGPIPALKWKSQSR